MLLEHFRKEHKKTKATDTNVDSNNEAKDIHEEHRQLKNNFERLNNMFQDSLEEVKRVKSEYEAKLIEANEKVRQTVAENEVLKEKVDVLFKLGRSYINRHDLKEAAKQKEPTEDDPDIIEVVESDELTVEDLEAWTKNKSRVFKRVSPSNQSENKKTSPKSQESGATPPNPPKSPTGQPSGAPGTTPPTPAAPIEERHQPNERKLYCHYFVNQRKCVFEEKTGQKCKFLHEQAPICRAGTGCSRSKCMYTHPNCAGMRTNQNFLDFPRGFPQMMNPWQTVNPWMNQNPFPQYQNPWNTSGNQGSQ